MVASAVSLCFPSALAREPGQDDGAAHQEGRLRVQCALSNVLFLV